MEIRKATFSDYVSIVRSIQNKKLAYITTQHIRDDITKNRQYVMTDKGKIVAVASVVYDNRYNYSAIKRLCVPNKKNHGKGFAQEMIKFITSCTSGKVGCTPWTDNFPMRHTLEKWVFG